MQNLGSYLETPISYAVATVGLKNHGEIDAFLMQKIGVHLTIDRDEVEWVKNRCGI